MGTIIFSTILMLFFCLCFFPRISYSLSKNKKIITPYLIISKSRIDLKTFIKISVFIFLLCGPMVNNVTLDSIASSDDNTILWGCVIWSSVSLIIGFLCYSKIFKIIKRKYVVFEDKLISEKSRGNIQDYNEEGSYITNMLSYFQFEKFESLYKLYIKVGTPDFTNAHINSNYYIVAYRNFYVVFDKEFYELDSKTRLVSVESLVEKKVVKGHKKGFYY